MKRDFRKWSAEQDKLRAQRDAEREDKKQQPSEDELQGMTVKELRALAAARKLEAPSKAKKSELVAPLS